MPRKKSRSIKNEKRVLKYINNYGVEVLIPEDIAGPLHYQMKKFLGDQFGDMTPPRNVVRIGQQERDSKYIIGNDFENELNREEFLRKIGK